MVLTSSLIVFSGDNGEIVKTAGVCEKMGVQNRIGFAKLAFTNLAKPRRAIAGKHWKTSIKTPNSFAKGCAIVRVIASFCT